MRKSPLEQHTRNQINLRLTNLGWNLNERDPKCTVTQEHALTEDQNRKFRGNRPDYVLYEAGTENPIAIIEAKRPGEDIDIALRKAIDVYAKPIDAPLAFAFDDVFVTAAHVPQSRPLKIDGEELQDFVDQLTALRFVHEGPEILSAPKGTTYTREQLLQIFKITNNLLRKEGLREGFERFSAFAEILFLKLVDESERLKEHKGQERLIESRYCWSHFVEKYSGQALVDYVRDTVWKRLRKTYGDIFAPPFRVERGATLDRIVAEINPINLTSTDTDVKGDAFEYFLKSVTNGNKDLGEYFTPRHIVRTMVHLVKPQFGEKIYDPFSGTGGFLLEAFKYLSLRIDTTKEDLLRTLRHDTLYGRELTSTARIAKMNMVLFGDGHSNVEQIDSLENPIKEKFEIVLSNIPYSQDTEFGSYYPIPTKNADSVCVQHIWNSLKVGGRAAVIVPETFLYEGGVLGQTRELIAKNAEKLSIFSLPRGVFMPYTPTKTNIIYFVKGGSFKRVNFFVVHNDGFELNTGRKPLAGESDLKRLLGQLDDPKIIHGKANIVEREDIEKSGDWNLRPYYYMEDIPVVNGELISLGEGKVIQEVVEKVDPRENPEVVWKLLEVSQNGIFLSDEIEGSEATQAYKVVSAGDLVYNPYRVNIGSIGIVPSYLHNALVSPAYVVFRVIKSGIPPLYILSILKTPRYLRILMNYSLGSARASIPFTELARIKIPKPEKDVIKDLTLLDTNYDDYMSKANDVKKRVADVVGKYVPQKDSAEDNPRHYEDFNALLRKAVGVKERKPKG